MIIRINGLTLNKFIYLSLSKKTTLILSMTFHLELIIIE